MGLRGLARKALQGLDYVRYGSCRVRGEGTVGDFLADGDNTVLVSFPRTGSHMVRMVLELYFDRPLLPRTFYHPLADDFLLHHTHDKELDFSHPTVIYLFREPVDTVFSELRYRGRSGHDGVTAERIARHYGRHLARWTLEEDFTRRKTIITYEATLARPLEAVAHLCEHFGAELDESRARAAWNRVSKDEVARKTRHDPKVVKKRRDGYTRAREEFRREYGDRVRRVIADVDSRLPAMLQAAHPEP